jgi:hypothetical protein
MTTPSSTTSRGSAWRYSSLAAPRITLDVERVRVALLFVRAVLLTALEPPSEHGSIVLVRRYTRPPPGAFV